MNTPRYFIPTFFLLLLLVLLGWSGVVELRAEEPRRAIVAMEMVLSGDYLVPHIHGWSYYNKPPVFNWLMALGFHLFGSFSEWVVRLPSLLSFVAMGWLHYRLLRSRLGQHTALLAAAFTITAADLLFYGSVNAGEIDLFFSFLTYAQVMCIFVFYERRQYGWMFLLSYLLAAIGTLTKGPPSVAFQALTILVWLVWQREWRLLFGWRHIASGLLFLGIVVGYFWWYDQHDDGVGFAVRLFKEASQRTGLETSIWDTLQGVVSFPLLLAKLIFPWSLLVVFWWKNDFWKKVMEVPLLRFSLLFLLANLPLYWISGDHKSRYLYMFLPFLATLLAYFYEKGRHLRPQWAVYFRLFLFSIMTIGTIAFLLPPFLPWTSDLPAVWWKTFLVSALGISLWIAARRQSVQRLWYFLLFLLVCRLAMNFNYLPLIEKGSSHLSYRQHVNNILEITGDAPVHWAGQTYIFRSDASIGPLELSEVELRTAPLIAYQIPYYLTKGNGQVMQFDSSRVAGRYYLIDAKKLKGQTVDTLYQFRERWQQMDLVLFKASD